MTDLKCLSVSYSEFLKNSNEFSPFFLYGGQYSSPKLMEFSSWKLLTDYKLLNNPIELQSQSCFE